MITTELGTVEIRLPFKILFWYKERKVGFRFNILSWTLLCQLFEPEIEFHQIEELQKTNEKQIFEKMVLAGALAYHFKYKNNPVVSVKNINYWLYQMPAGRKDLFVSMIQIAILNSKMMGKTMSSIITESQEEKKK
jgi:hypothetical protein